GGGFLGADAGVACAARLTRQAQVDLVELRLLSVALVVDREAAALQADLAEVASVEAERAHGVEPGEQRAESFQAAARGRRGGGRRGCRRSGEPARRYDRQRFRR